MSLIPFDLVGLMIGGSGGNDFAELKSIKAVWRLLQGVDKQYDSSDR